MSKRKIPIDNSQVAEFLEYHSEERGLRSPRAIWKGNIGKQSMWHEFKHGYRSFSKTDFDTVCEFFSLNEKDKSELIDCIANDYLKRKGFI